jgi:hypothetical protein
MADMPFDSIENAQEYLRLLSTEVENARTAVDEDIVDAARERSSRRLDALHLVEYKLKNLSQHLSSSLRILNDLRMLRRLLVADGETVAAAPQDSVKTARPQL